MGCICSKGVTSNNEFGESLSRDQELTKSLKESKRSSKRFVSTSKRDEVVVEVDNGVNEVTTRLISSTDPEENVCSIPVIWEEEREKDMVFDTSMKSQVVDVGMSSKKPQIPRVFGNHDGQVAAGWPSWLSAVAGEAINGWVPRKADSFEKLDKIGQGTYSSVYKARDLETGLIVALKKVRFANMDPESVRFMAREILILRRLDHPNIMRLEGLVTSRVSGNLYLVFEYMDHDLAGLASSPTIKFSEPQIKCYMEQLFLGLEHCHNRGVLHRDIKGSNLLIDNKGNLKIGDFGLATFFHPNQKQPLTSRVVTLWYRPPELLLGATDYGVGVDLWSAGCILAELYAGRPIMPGRTEVEQLHKIFKLCGSPSDEYWQRSKLPHGTIFKPQHPYKRCVVDVFKDFPHSVISLLEVLLAFEPERRGYASSALHSEFFRTAPFPCDPSSLPRYPPTKELDAKLRDEEMRRRKQASGKGDVHESHKDPRESKARPAPDANAELVESIQKRLLQPNTRSNSEKFQQTEEGGSGFPIEPSRATSHDGPTYSGRSSSKQGGETLLGQSAIDSHKNGVRSPNSLRTKGSSQLSRFSNSVTVRGNSRFYVNKDAHLVEEEPPDAVNSQMDDSVPMSKHEAARSKDREKDNNDVENGLILVNGTKKNRIHYSGPLLPPGRNMDEMLKEHEKHIQHAVRKARTEKNKARKMYDDNGQTESLLHNGGNIH
ncbi:probable serine/threonine-protein kinase At1g09600 [Impatiens glandulifera]|uniref:probable serine/threonine-protein kinase At1g09600 n=1 Tax=Impatiens glandulifera TaxID=253017 RepID=UPI001FB183DA|nr:probable serine/threonine-protein kinase At1g09600 [Impatiens glandulifera]